MEFISGQFPILLAEYETLLENIGQFLEMRMQEKDRKELLPRLSVQEIKKQTAEALEELQHFRSQPCAQRAAKGSGRTAFTDTGTVEVI